MARRMHLRCIFRCMSISLALVAVLTSGQNGADEADPRTEQVGLHANDGGSSASRPVKATASAACILRAPMGIGTAINVVAVFAGGGIGTLLGAKRYAAQREHDVVSDARKELKEVSLHVGRWP
jgi:hypothetical protein